jgi:hypothetical protein
MMRVNRLLFVVLLGLVMASGVAFAQRTYPTVETTGGYGRGLMVFGGNISGGSGPTGCTGAVDLSAGCALPMLHGVP